MASRWAALVLLVLLAASSRAAWGEETPPSDWTVDNFRWTGTLAPSSGIEVRNRYGDVRLRAADAGEVEASAMIQRRTSDPRAEVKLGRRRGRLTIEVVYPPGPRRPPSRVDLAVFVPAGARVTVRTKQGMIQARGLANDVDFASANGDVFLSTTGTARVAVGRGSITAELRRDAWGRAPRLATGAGNISLRLPADADAQVRIHAAGGISVRRPAHIDRRSSRAAVVTLGDGHHPLSLKARQGEVTVLAAHP